MTVVSAKLASFHIPKYHVAPFLTKQFLLKWRLQIIQIFIVFSDEMSLVIQYFSCFFYDI